MLKYHNLYQIVNDFAKIRDDSVFVNGEFDLEYFQTAYNVVSGQFDVVGDGTTTQTIDNRKQLGNRLIEEFINDFVDYWNNIDSIVEPKLPDEAARTNYRNIKRSMFLVLRSFTIYKGTDFLIRFVYDLYSTLTTTEFWIDSFVVKNFATTFSNSKNLEYNLSGNLPTYVWENVIKPTVHPAGWVCNYFGLEVSEDGNIVSYDDKLRNDYCYIDYAGCNEIVNNNVYIPYDFDGLKIAQSDLLRSNKTRFQFDAIKIVANNIAPAVVTLETS